MQQETSNQSSALRFPRQNNLELLRLVFAFQVAVFHGGEHFGFPVPEMVTSFPGVPAFFFVSGFLIYASYLNAPGRRYFENRFLWLFPGLLFVILGAMVVVLIAQGWRDLMDNLSIYSIWLVAQLTLGQAYNPALFRDVGVGAINGSLWTITTEIIFYLCIPAIVHAEKRFRHLVPVLTFLSFLVYAVGPHIESAPMYRGRTLFDIISLTPITWGWMFGFGILAVKNFDLVDKYRTYLPLLLAPLIVMAVFGEGPFFGSKGNQLGFVYFFCYGGIVLWIAFGLSPIKLTFDFSYGAYIWHMPVINLLLVLSLPSPWLAFLLTVSFAALSWFLVERPMLRRKRISLKAFN